MGGGKNESRRGRGGKIITEKDCQESRDSKWTGGGWKEIKRGENINDYSKCQVERNTKKKKKKKKRKKKRAREEGREGNVFIRIEWGPTMWENHNECLHRRSTEEDANSWGQGADCNAQGTLTARIGVKP